MNKQTLKKLGSYSAAAIAIIGIQKEAEGQVVYTNIRDTLLNLQNSVIFLDLNNDGVLDFRFKAGEATDDFITAGGTGNSMIATTGSESWPALYPVRLKYLDPIDANQLWGRQNFGLIAMETSGGDTHFDGTYGMPIQTADGYLGVRFKVGANQHYGWVRLDCSDNAKWLVIKDFAYNATPGVPINAGQTGEGCGDILEPNNDLTIATPLRPNVEYKGIILKREDKDFYKFEIKSAAPSVKISLSNLQKNYNLLLMDAAGNNIGKSFNKKTENEVIVLNDAAPGQYYLRVNLKDISRFDLDYCYSIEVKTSAEPFVTTRVD